MSRELSPLATKGGGGVVEFPDTHLNIRHGGVELGLEPRWGLAPMHLIPAKGIHRRVPRYKLHEHERGRSGVVAAGLVRVYLGDRDPRPFPDHRHCLHLALQAFEGLWCVFVQLDPGHPMRAVSKVKAPHEIPAPHAVFGGETAGWLAVVVFVFISPGLCVDCVLHKAIPVHRP